MSLLSDIFSGGVKGIGEGIGELAKDIRAAITGVDMDKKAELEQKLLELESLALSGQIQTNIEEAKHKSVFVAGWRPFIGWVAGMSLATYYIPQYLLGAYVWVVSYIDNGVIAPYPMGVDGLMELVVALLGMASLRSFEKLKGVSSSSLGAQG